MTDTAPEPAPRVLFLSQPPERVGPPILLLGIARWLRAHTDIEVGFVVKGDGPLVASLRELGPVWIVPDRIPDGPRRAVLKALARVGWTGSERRLRRFLLRRAARSIGSWPIVYVNSAGAGSLLPLLPAAPERVIVHVHELAVGLDLHLPPDGRELLAHGTDRFIAVSDAVARELVERRLARPGQITTIPGGIDLHAPGPDRSGGPTRAALGIPDDAFVVGAAGDPHWRKGPDLFASLAARLSADGDAATRFLWIGGQADAPLVARLRDEVARAGLEDRVRFVPHQDDLRPWLDLLDVFVLTSREDAFPLVVLEAAAAGLPVVTFASGGAAEFVGDDAGAVVPYPDLDAMACQIARMHADPDARHALGATGRARVAESYDLASTAARVLAVIRSEAP